MSHSKNALLLFCKPPVPGLVKTRLCKENGGPLTPEQAADFFRVSLLDETDLAMYAMELLEEKNAVERIEDPSIPLKSYDFFVSTTPADDLPLTKKVFESEGDWDRPIEYQTDSGASFDEHFNDAFSQIFAKGYDNVVAMGGDMPLLPPEHIVNAFGWLDYLSEHHNGLGFVMAPCQESGSSLVGQTRKTPISADGIYYNVRGRPVVDGYLDLIHERKIPFAYLSAVSDVDTREDLAHLISCLEAIAEASEYQPGLYLPRRVLGWIYEHRLQAIAPPNKEHDPRQYIDMST